MFTPELLDSAEWLSLLTIFFLKYYNLNINMSVLMSIHRKLNDVQILRN